MASLAEVLKNGESSKIDLDSPKASQYLDQLTTFPLSHLLSEPANLSSTSSQLTNALTNLCTSSYPTFLSLHTTTSDLTSTLDSFSSTLDGLLEDLPSLETSARSLSSEITSVQASRRRAALVLEHSAKLQDVLEIPLLAEACVRNGYFQEALDLAAHAATIAARFPAVSVIQDVRLEVDAAVRTLLAQLLGMLREPAKLPQLFKAVNFLRRMQVLPEHELALAFLTGRLETLEYSLRALGLEKKGVDKDREKEVWVRFMKRYVDAWREGVHDLITQYTAIFLERATPSDLAALQTLLPAATAHLLNGLLEELGEALPRIADPTALNSLLTQLTYCATSFARVGLDFRSLLPPLFAGAVARTVGNEICAAKEQFARTLETNKSRPSRSWLFTGTGAPVHPPTNVLDSPPHVPPAILASYPPLANYANALLTTLNSLRLLAPKSILSELSRTLDTALAESASVLLGYAREQGEGEEKEVVRAAGETFVKAFVPFVRRALLEGVYGEKSETGMEEKLRSVLDDWAVLLQDGLSNGTSESTTA
ncbi:Dor1-domain-containing protein [Peniophora sp. CONT]|nr:Dor1-domain-containing protein [Peniophora sp. CONT]